MRDWLERLFAAEGIDCSINLEWFDDAREFVVHMKHRSDHCFLLTIEALVRDSEAEIILGYIKPIANIIRSSSR